jgi:hypothetical protein
MCQAVTKPGKIKCLRRLGKGIIGSKFEGGVKIVSVPVRPNFARL